ncbi:MAG: response regulator, partial [Rheinheimera sp.]
CVLSFAADGEAATSLCQKQQFDLIIMDQQMPGLDGRQATAAIRAMGIKTPVISLSADVFEEPQHGLQSIFQRTMTKPFTRQALLKTISELLLEYPPIMPAPITDSHLTAGLAQSNNNQLPELTTEEDEITIEYRQSLPADAAKLANLWAAADWPAVQTLLHKIKGTSACFGLQQISDQAHILAQQLKNGHGSDQELNILLQKLNDAGL